MRFRRAGLGTTRHRTQTVTREIVAPSAPLLGGQLTRFSNLDDFALSRFRQNHMGQKWRELNRDILVSMIFDWVLGEPQWVWKVLGVLPQAQWVNK